MPIALDYTTRIDPADLVAAGVTDVCRYLSWPYRWGGVTHNYPNPKIIQQREFDELVAAGLGVTLNWEFDARDWMGGNSDGLAHGAEAARQALELGYPAGCTIAGSADFDMTRAQWLAAGKGYAIGWTSALLVAGYRPGVYGPSDVLGWCADEVPMSLYWQCMSTAYSEGRNAQPWPGAHLRQRTYQTVGGVRGDRNDILRPSWGQYRKTSGPALAALEQEDPEMFFLPFTLPAGRGKQVAPTIPPVNFGTVPWGRAWLNLCNITPGGLPYAVRILVTDAARGVGLIAPADVKTRTVRALPSNPQAFLVNSAELLNFPLPDNLRGLWVERVPVDELDACAFDVTAGIEYARRAS
jgi:hypothetical protein